MVSCDFSGQELRLAAHGSKDPLWVNAMLNGEDLHSIVASNVFNIPIENVRDKPEFLKGKSYRDVAKTINFGLIYGMSKFKLSNTLGISVEDADKIIKDYFKNTKDLNQMLEQYKQFGLDNGYIRSYSPYRIIRYFPKWKANRSEMDQKDIGSIERQSMNTPVQAGGSQMCKRALYLVRKYIKDNELQDLVYIVMTIHDQIDCEVIDWFAEEWSLIQKNIMEEAGREIITNVPVLSEITISDCWSK